MLVRFVKATIEGNYLAVANEKRAKDVLASELKLSDPKIIDASYANFKAATRDGSGRIPPSSASRAFIFGSARAALIS